MKIVVTGANGLIGWHAHARLHAANCQAVFKGKPAPFDIAALDRDGFNHDESLREALHGADAVLHFAGVNRAPDDVLEAANPEIATRLVRTCTEVGSAPHIVYASSIHATADTVYGRSKRIAGEILERGPGIYAGLVLPHVFGEGARPHYNNVTATLIDHLVKGDTPSINPQGEVRLLHAGDAAQDAIDAALNGIAGTVVPTPRSIGVPELFEMLCRFHALYRNNSLPDLSDPFDLALFNTYRTATYPDGWPRPLVTHWDARGSLVEAVKGGSGGQAFFSTTRPGVTRGDHFHLHKFERFLVLSGDAIIRIRRVLSDEVWEYRVSGDRPAPVDIPTLHTHSIENVGDEDLLTLFWTNEVFDPENPDTYADKVLP